MDILIVGIVAFFILAGLLPRALWFVGIVLVSLGTAFKTVAWKMTPKPPKD